MNRYFGHIEITIEADSEAEAEVTQMMIRDGVLDDYKDVVETSCDEPVEFDEFGHAG